MCILSEKYVHFMWSCMYCTVPFVDLLDQVTLYLAILIAENNHDNAVLQTPQHSIFSSLGTHLSGTGTQYYPTFLTHPSSWAVGSDGRTVLGQATRANQTRHLRCSNQLNLSRLNWTATQGSLEPRDFILPYIRSRVGIGSFWFEFGPET